MALHQEMSLLIPNLCGVGLSCALWLSLGALSLHSRGPSWLQSLDEQTRSLCLVCLLWAASEVGLARESNFLMEKFISLGHKPKSLRQHDADSSALRGLRWPIPCLYVSFFLAGG